MKPTALLLLMLLLPVAGQNQHEVPQPPRGVIVHKLEENRLKAQEVFLLAVTSTHVAYKLNAGAVQPEIKRMTEVDSLMLYEPADYLEALDLYEAHKYTEAMKLFVKVKERYTKPFPGLANNPGVMSGFYELECLRQMNDLEGLRAALKDYKKDALTSKVALQQLELYELWDAIRAERNREALVLADRYAGKRLPGDQRAQVAYCQGRAMEALLYLDHRILMAYQTAITADAGSSEIITRDAIMRSLEIIHQDEHAKTAMRAFEQGEKVQGLNLLMEAAGLCAMYENQFAGAEPLPAQYRHFLKFTPEKVQERFKQEEGG